MSRPMTGLYAPRPRPLVLAALVDRARRRLQALPEPRLVELLEDAVYNERRRLKGRSSVEEVGRIEDAARAVVRGAPEDRLRAALGLVEAWAEEIHGRFDPRIYRVATRVLPRTLSALLAAPDRRRVDPAARVRVEGDTPFLQELAQEGTLLLAPTHVSNLDSPLIGLALYLSGLPPFVYGAGLNLFSNPLLGFWMRRLGAYTVDRTKSAELYKETLKDYSVEMLTTRHHSLFFPGGTRARSGAVEARVKKGLLGTGLSAWQEMLAAGRPDPEVYVVPLTLSFTLVLEANTLIHDFLAESGKQRYIITDDEFAEPRTLLQFAQRVLDLDSAVVARFGQPLDVLGRPVPRDRAERAEAAARRRRAVCDRDGKVEPDEQRDRVYTDQLGAALVRSWRADTVTLPTHAVAEAAWQLLVRRAGTRDPFRLVRIPVERRTFDEAEVLTELSQLTARLAQRQARGEGRMDLRESPERTLADALDHFGRYHRTRAVGRAQGALVIEDPHLCLYYRNRLAHLEGES